jgi:hypothetical protein
MPCFIHKNQEEDTRVEGPTAIPPERATAAETQTKDATVTPKELERAEWIADHLDRHDTVVKREQYDECLGCGATYWRDGTVGRSPQPEQAQGDVEIEPGLYRAQSSGSIFGAASRPASVSPKDEAIKALVKALMNLVTTCKELNVFKCDDPEGEIAAAEQAIALAVAASPGACLHVVKPPDTTCQCGA